MVRSSRYSLFSCVVTMTAFAVLLGFVFGNPKPAAGVGIQIEHASVRDLLAGAALAGLVARGQTNYSAAYKIADQALKDR